VNVYLAGPMTGWPDFNAVGFAAAELYAEARGWTPVSPHTTNPAHDGPCPPGERHTAGAGSHPYPCWVRASLRAMLTADAVLMLPGWQQSKGARREHAIAEWCEMPIHEMPAGGDPW
jgi:hypothetical protein